MTSHFFYMLLYLMTIYMLLFCCIGWLFLGYKLHIMQLNILQENLLRCYNAMQDTSMDDEYESEIDLVSSSYAPVNVLDCRVSSSGSDKTNVTTTDTKATSSSSDSSTTSTKLSPERDTKRRKLSSYRNNHSIQLSQTQQCWWHCCAEQFESCSW